VTGIVGAGTRPSDATRTAQAQEFAFVAGGARFVARSMLTKRDQVMVGERVSLECTFELVSPHGWSGLELPSEWSGDWLVEQIVSVGSAARENYALDLVPVLDRRWSNRRAEHAEAPSCGARRTTVYRCTASGSLSGTARLAACASSGGRESVR